MAKGRKGDIAKGEENVTMEKEAEAEEQDAEKTGEEAHGSTEKREMESGEELKRGGRMKHKRARGGHVAKHSGKHGLDAAEHHKVHMAEHQKPHHPHHHPRKRGGHVPGKMGMHRPDKRARGGATSDVNPTTAAGNMSVPEYERQPHIPNGGGKMGHSRRD